LVGWFPLILTFSLEEKEQPLGLFVKFVGCEAACSRDFAKTLGTFLPLFERGLG
jgi:hypothetical protein